jgi:hypothetical protein
MSRSGYYIGDLVPATVNTAVPIPPGYVLTPAPAPAPITAATGGLNLDWRGEPIANPRRELVPVVEMEADGRTHRPVMVPLAELDSLVGELSDDFDFGLGQYEITNRHELGALSLSFKAPKLTLPKLSFTVGKGKYTPLRPASAPTAKAPVRAAVKKVIKAKKKPVVIARKKPEQLPAANLSQIYAELKRQGKIVNLLATKKKLSAEHTRKMSNEGFKGSVMDLLRKIEKQCAGDASGNYFARWNALKKATGVGTQIR